MEDNWVEWRIIGWRIIGWKIMAGGHWVSSTQNTIDMNFIHNKNRRISTAEEIMSSITDQRQHRPQACIEATDIPASRAIRQVYLGFQDEGR